MSHPAMNALGWRAEGHCGEVPIRALDSSGSPPPDQGVRRLKSATALTRYAVMVAMLRSAAWARSRSMTKAAVWVTRSTSIRSRTVGSRGSRWYMAKVPSTLRPRVRDRGRPAGAKPVGDGDVLVIRLQRIGRDIGHEHRRAQVCRMSRTSPEHGPICASVDPPRR